jgi:hypothetical protein
MCSQVHRQGKRDVVVSIQEPANALDGFGNGRPFPGLTRPFDQNVTSDKT